MKIAVLVLVLAIAVPAQRPPRQQKQPSASADSTKTTQPTLEETLAFLKERITADAFYKEESNENTKHVRTYRAESIRFDGCAVELQDVSLSEFEGDRSAATTKSMQRTVLSDLDAERVVVEREGAGVGHFAVLIYTLQEKPKVQLHTELIDQSYHSVHDESFPQFSVSFSEKAVAEKVAKAFRAAIKLCAAKKDLF